MYLRWVLPALIIHTFPRLGIASCPPYGPMLPRPTTIATSKGIQSALANLTDSLNAALAGRIEAGWHVPNTSFSIALVAHDDKVAGQPAWEFHHRGSANVQGVNVVDGNSQYLIGSVSKLLSNILLRRTGLSTSKPVTDWLPEIKRQSRIEWESITLDSLGNHLAGIPPNIGLAEYYYLLEVFRSVGFPDLKDLDFPECGVIALNEDCTKQQILNRVLELYPVSPANQRPVYSQLAFTLMGYAMTAALGQNYSELLLSYVTRPLGMNNTFPSPGEDKKAVIPPVDNNWGLNFSENVPGGGLVSTTNDLSRLTQSILKHTIFRSEAEVRRWLKPNSDTTAPGTSVGSPWEIFRTSELVPGQITDVYTKGGGVYGYGSLLSVVDQYGVGFVILKAGSPNAEYLIFDSVLSTLLPAIEEEARAQAQKYIGNFTSTGNQTATQATFSIDSGSGIRLDSLYRGGQDIIAGIHKIWPYTALSVGGTLSSEVMRLYPTGTWQEAIINLPKTEKPITVILEDWRVSFDVVREFSKSDLPRSGFMRPEELCLSWQSVDWIYYGQEPIDRLVFILDKDTRDVVGLEIPFLRSNLTKVASNVPVMGY